MTHAYLLWHVHDLGDEEDWKFVGVYSSPTELAAAQDRVGRLPGFRDTPDAFRAEKIAVDVDQWTDGFVTLDDE